MGEVGAQGCLSPGCCSQQQPEHRRGAALRRLRRDLYGALPQHPARRSFDAVALGYPAAGRDDLYSGTFAALGRRLLRRILCPDQGSSIGSIEGGLAMRNKRIMGVLRGRTLPALAASLLLLGGLAPAWAQMSWHRDYFPNV